MAKTILQYLHRQYHLQVPENLWARIGIMVLMLTLAVFDFFAWVGGIIISTMLVLALFNGSAQLSMTKGKPPAVTTESEISVTAPHHIHSN